jgi:hypothetical protein
LIAYLACETGIAPSQLLAESPRMLYTLVAYLRYKSVKQNPNTPYNR